MLNTDNAEAIRIAVLSDLFGASVSSIFDASWDSVQLPRHVIKEIPAKKMKSLSGKYFSLPKEHPSNYPAVPDAIANAPGLRPLVTALVHWGNARQNSLAKQRTSSSSNNPRFSSLSALQLSRNSRNPSLSQNLCIINT